MRWLLLGQFFFAFWAVTLDEFVILVLFFSRCFIPNQSMQSIQVFVGHIIAFSLIIALSIAIGSGGLIIPYKYLSYLGLIPISIGAYDLLKRIPRFIRCDSSQSTSIDEAAKNGSGHVGVQESDSNSLDAMELTRNHDTAENRPLVESSFSQHHSYDSISARSTSSIVSTSTVMDTIDDSNGYQDCYPAIVLQRLSISDPDMLTIIGTALAEGSEEVAVLAPLFAMTLQNSMSSSNPMDPSIKNGNLSLASASSLFVVVLWLYSLLFVELIAAYLIARLCWHPTNANSQCAMCPPRIQKALIKLGLPIVLIMVGVSVLMEIP